MVNYDGDGSSLPAGLKPMGTPIKRCNRGHAPINLLQAAVALFFVFVPSFVSQKIPTQLLVIMLWDKRGNNRTRPFNDMGKKDPILPLNLFFFCTAWPRARPSRRRRSNSEFGSVLNTQKGLNLPRRAALITRGSS
jgi:hypothetical protein